MIRTGGHHMIFPDSYGRDQYSPAEEARHEAEQAAAEAREDERVEPEGEDG